MAITRTISEGDRESLHPLWRAQIAEHASDSDCDGGPKTPRRMLVLIKASVRHALIAADPDSYECGRAASQKRHNRAVLGSWDELIDKVGPRPGMFVGQDRYALVRSFVEGFGAARNDGVLHGFQHWLSSQPQHRAINNYAWSSLLLHEVFPERDRLIKPAWQQDPATADARRPLPPPSPVSEDDLAYPEDDRQAIAHLFSRLREYLNSQPAPGES